ncbi:hypothetical protein LZ554_001448 [Drepanopeziza brunnea f. sp. 'monogermtubi']|nr:hypothetical protein LZ554_001448 [Drepanopeziza brunnea f. sp. 'monogermtubi']
MNLLLPWCPFAPQVLIALRDTIERRQKIHLFWRKRSDPKDPKNLSHGHFISVMAKIWKNLSSYRTFFKRNVGLRLEEQTLPVDEGIFSKNIYSTLHDLTIETEDTKTDVGASTSTQHIGIVPPKVRTRKRPAKKRSAVAEAYAQEYTFDDDFTHDMNSLLFQSEMDSICDRVKSYWGEVASGSMSIALAAWMTSLACFHVKHFLIPNMLEIDENIADDFERKPADTADKFPAESEYESVKYAPISGQRLRSIGTAIHICHMVDYYGSLPAPELAPETRDNPTKFLSHPLYETDEVREQSDMICIDKILKSLKAHRDPEKSSTAINSSIPIVYESGNFYTKTNSVDLRFSFEIHLLIESYKGYLWPMDNISPDYDGKCMMSVLQFAMDMSNVIREVMRLRPNQSRGCDPRRCIGAMAEVGIELLEYELRKFLKQARLDLFHQAPWVIGQQMLFMQAQAIEWISYHCNYMQLLGITLHLYNCLQNLGLLPKENVLLEPLSEILTGQIFQDVRPKSKFFSRFNIFLGARITFARKRSSQCRMHGDTDEYLKEKDGKGQASARSYRVGMPGPFKYKPQLNGGDNLRFKCFRVSKAMSLYRLSYSVPDLSNPELVSAWAAVTGSSLPSNYNQRDLERVKDRVCKDKFGNVMDKILKTVRPEFMGTFAPAVINWPQVYLTCMEILDSIAIAAAFMEESPRGFPSKESRLTGVRGIVQMLLRDADKAVTTPANMRIYLKEREEEIEYCRIAFTEALEDKTRKDFVFAI